MELGRDREGLGQPASAAHEHPDTASYQLHAFGERLLLDPGYLTFETRSEVNKASDHNIVLVNGTGPFDPFFASIRWIADRAGLPPGDGEATMTGLAGHRGRGTAPGSTPTTRARTSPAASSSSTIGTS